MSDKFRGMLGLAMRAGRVMLGTETVLAALSSGRVRLVILSVGASDAAKTRIMRKCEFYKVRSLEVGMTLEELGSLLGKSYTPACVGVSDEGFAERLLVLAEADQT